MTIKHTLTTAATCVAILWLASEATTVQASEQVTTYPHVIRCELKGVWHFAYLDRVEADGRAVYITPSRMAASITKGGVIRRKGAITGSCAGKTLKELVARGEAHFIRE
ncbi:MAG: hypothetical protein O7I42_05685 [Alphaproteobacteria bacterium]|nr:hypothetical protein [Alphaproteobacteria bacterium]